MPHDYTGAKISVGDVVTVRCKVKAIHDTEEYCYLDLETEKKIYTSDNRSYFTLNVKQVEKV